MKDNNLKLKLQKGIILLHRKTKVSPRLTKPKFFVLMENYTPDKDSMLVIMTTSKLSSSITRKGAGATFYSPHIEKEKTLVLFRQIFDVPIKTLAKEYEVLGMLSNRQLNKLEKAIRMSGYISKKKKRRLLQRLPKIKKVIPPPDPYIYLTKEQVKAMKEKLSDKI